MNINNLRAKWTIFKKKRNDSPENFDHKDPDFLTVKQRERMLDLLFYYVEFIK